MPTTRLVALALAVATGISTVVAPLHAGPPGPGAPVAEVSLPFEKITLANGLTVILAEDHRAPVVGVDLHVRAGSREDPPGKRGMASLTREVYANAVSRRLSEEARRELFRALGVRAWKVASSHNLDYAWFHASLPAAALPTALWLESDRLAFAAGDVDDEAVRKAREELASRQGPVALNENVTRALHAMVFGAAHPYGGVSHGPSQLAAVTTADVRAALRASFVPERAVLTVSGDFVPSRAKDLVQRCFGSIAAGPRSAPAPVPPPAISGERRARMAADVEAPTLAVAWPAPPFFTDDDTLLDLGATLLAARLENKLVTASGPASSVWAREASNDHGSMFHVRVTLRPGRSAAEALAALDREVADLAANVGADEMRGPQLRWFTDVLESFDAPAARARAFGAIEAGAGDAGRLSRRATTHRDAAPAALRRALAATLRPDRRAILEVVPTPGAPRQGQLTGGTP